MISTFTETVNRHSRLRDAFYTRLQRWDASGQLKDESLRNANTTAMAAHLWWLLNRVAVNYRDYFTYGDLCTDAELRLVESMLGEHGWSIYCTLRIQREALEANCE